MNHSFEIHRVGIFGLGTMGPWIAKKFISAGFDVTLCDISEIAVQKARATLGSSHPYKTTTSVTDTAKNSDLLIETIPESVDLKQRFFDSIDSFIEPGAIVTSNTSMLSPTEFLKGFKHRTQFACFHFYLPNTIVDIAPLPETNPEVISVLEQVAKKIGELPILLRTHVPGYLVGAMGSVLTDMALELLAREIADAKAIDAAWKIVTSSRMGPLEALDTVGLDTSLQIRRARLASDPNNSRLQSGILLLEKYVANGWLGRKSGRGLLEYGTP